MSLFNDIRSIKFKQLVIEEYSKDESPKEALQRKIDITCNNISLGNLCCLLFFSLSLFVLLLVFFQYFFDKNNAYIMIFLSSIFLVAGIITYRATENAKNRLRYLELESDIEQFDMNKEVNYAEKTLRLHNIQLEKYYTQNLSQSKYIFFIGLICIFFGVGIVAATCYFLKMTDIPDTSKIIIGILGGLSALLTDFVSVIFLKMNSEISSTLRDFHSRLVDTHKVLMGCLISEKIGDKELKHQTLSEIAKEICGKKYQV